VLSLPAREEGNFFCAHRYLRAAHNLNLKHGAVLSKDLRRQRPRHIALDLQGDEERTLGELLGAKLHHHLSAGKPQLRKAENAQRRNEKGDSGGAGYAGSRSRETQCPEHRYEQPFPGHSSAAQPSLRDLWLCAPALRRVCLYRKARWSSELGCPAHPLCPDPRPGVSIICQWLALSSGGR